MIWQILAIAFYLCGFGLLYWSIHKEVKNPVITAILWPIVVIIAMFKK